MLLVAPGRFALAWAAVPTPAVPGRTCRQRWRRRERARRLRSPEQNGVSAWRSARKLRPDDLENRHVIPGIWFVGPHQRTHRDHLPVFEISKPIRQRAVLIECRAEAHGNDMIGVFALRRVAYPADQFMRIGGGGTGCGREIAGNLAAREIDVGDVDDQMVERIGPSSDERALDGRIDRPGAFAIVW